MERLNHCNMSKHCCARSLERRIASDHNPSALLMVAESCGWLRLPHQCGVEGAMTSTTRAPLPLQVHNLGKQKYATATDCAAICICGCLHLARMARASQSQPPQNNELVSICPRSCLQYEAERHVYMHCLVLAVGPRNDHQYKRLT